MDTENTANNATTYTVTLLTGRTYRYKDYIFERGAAVSGVDEQSATYLFENNQVPYQVLTGSGQEQESETLYRDRFKIEVDAPEGEKLESTTPVVPLSERLATSATPRATIQEPIPARRRRRQ